MRWRTGEKIGNRYLVCDAISGGMGEVYLCWDEQQDAPYALKTLKAGNRTHLSTQQLLQLFRNEVDKWIALEEHPNIVRCFYMEIVEDLPFLFLEWVIHNTDQNFTGRSDLRTLQRGKPLSVRLSLEFAIDMCRGLIYAGEKHSGFVHRDLKPDNILIDQNMVAKITDFGLAIIVQRENLLVLDVTGKTGPHRGVAGTPPYMAPEQWQEGVLLDTRSDIYALGCILYEMLMGRQPYVGVSLNDLCHQHINGSLPRLSGDTFPPKLQDLLFQCLAKRKSDRFATIDELVQSLVAIYQEAFFESPPVRVAPIKFAAEDFIGRGTTYFRLERYDEAIVDFTRALEIAPTDEYAQSPDELALYLTGVTIKAYTNRGAAYAALNQNQRSFDDYNNAMACYLSASQPGGSFRLHESNAIMILSNRGRANARLHRYVEALADFSEVIQLAPADISGYEERASIYILLEQYDQAVKDFTRVIELDPDNRNAYSGRAFAYEGCRNFEMALADCTAAIRVDPHVPECYIARAQIYTSLNHFDEALRDYDRAIELDHTMPLAYSYRGVIRFEVQQYQGSYDDLTAAIQLGLSPSQLASWTYRLRADACIQLNRMEDATTDYKMAIQLDPENLDAHYGLANSYNELRLHDRCIEVYSGLLEILPEDSTLYTQRGNLYALLLRYDEALQDHIRALILDRNSAPGYYNCGTTYSLMERHNEAIAYYTRAIEIDPTLPDVYENRGVSYEKLELYHQALQDFKQAIRLDPDRGVTHLRAGAILANAGAFQQALPYFERAAQLGMPDGEAYTGRAKENIHLESIQAAFETFQRVVSKEELEAACMVFPQMVESSFVIDAERVIAEQVPQNLRSALQRRLDWLRQIANEQE